MYRTQDLQCNLLVLFYETKRKSTLVQALCAMLCVISHGKSIDVLLILEKLTDGDDEF